MNDEGSDCFDSGKCITKLPLFPKDWSRVKDCELASDDEKKVKELEDNVSFFFFLKVKKKSIKEQSVKKKYTFAKKIWNQGILFLF